MSRPTAQLGTGGHSGEMRTAGLAVMELTGGAVRQSPVMNTVQRESQFQRQIPISIDSRMAVPLRRWTRGASVLLALSLAHFASTAPAPAAAAAASEHRP